MQGLALVALVAFHGRGAIGTPAAAPDTVTLTAVSEAPGYPNLFRGSYGDRWNASILGNVASQQRGALRNENDCYTVYGNSWTTNAGQDVLRVNDAGRGFLEGLTNDVAGGVSEWNFTQSSGVQAYDSAYDWVATFAAAALVPNSVNKVILDMGGADPTACDRTSTTKTECTRWQCGAYDCFTIKGANWNGNLGLDEGGNGLLDNLHGISTNVYDWKFVPASTDPQDSGWDVRPLDFQSDFHLEGSSSSRVNAMISNTFGAESFACNM